jgi:hypothetical protein
MATPNIVAVGAGAAVAGPCAGADFDVADFEDVVPGIKIPAQM